jgi:hypothetical protein
MFMLSFFEISYCMYKFSANLDTSPRSKDGIRQNVIKCIFDTTGEKSARFLSFEELVSLLANQLNTLSAI